jgi:hypothetical protein
MTVAALPAVPRARAWRTRVHRARRLHRQRSLSDTLTDLYMILWLVVVYGYALLTSMQEHLRAPVAPPDLMTRREWIAVAVLLAGAGLAWRGLRAVGPLLASPAEQAWGVATPIDRRGWLLPRFVAVLAGGAATGAVTALLVIAFGLRVGHFGTAALAGSAFGIAGVTLCIVAQALPSARWPRLLGTTLTSAGAAAAAFMVIGYRMGHVPALPVVVTGRGLTMMGLALAVVSTVLAVSALRRLDHTALGAGAELASAAVASAVWLDPSLLTRVVEVQRWRRVGHVRRLPFVRVVGGRWSALLQAEARRLARRPGALVMWGALVLAQYAVAAVAPAVVGVSHVIGAYLAAGRLTAGLRAVAGSNGLRRSLGGDERVVRLIHLVVPTLGAVLWWAITTPAGGPRLGGGVVLLLAGIVGAAYRGATHSPMSYDGMTVDTPFGVVPIGLIIQLVRGPDLLGVVIVLQLILG